MPCKCTGSLNFIHFKCLKNWLEMKAQTKDAGNVYTVYWKNFECELCKNAYPFIFRVKDRLYKLVDMR